MIHSRELFESAIDEATRLLDALPAEGTPSYQRLMDLMREIAAYRPEVLIQSPADRPETKRLTHRLNAFEARVTPHFGPHWHAMVGGDLKSDGEAAD